MATRTRSPWPQRTTFWAGVCFVVAALLDVVLAVGFAIAVTPTFSLFIPNPVAVTLAAGFRAAGFLVAALGVRGEVGVAADSKLGKAALILFGVGDLVFVVRALLPVEPDGAAPPALVAVNTGFLVLLPVAALVAAAIVFRVAVLGGVARWVLLPIAVVELALVALQLGPFRELFTAMQLLPLEFLQPVLLLVLGAAYLVHGRGEALKHRAQVINENW